MCCVRRLAAAAAPAAGLPWLVGVQAKSVCVANTPARTQISGGDRMQEKQEAEQGEREGKEKKKQRCRWAAAVRQQCS